MKKFRRPANMDKMALPAETAAVLSRESMSIFFDCAQGGETLEKTLLAVYLSGLHHGVAIRKESKSRRNSSKP